MDRNLPTRATNARFAKQESARARATKAVERLEKAPTGINGLDEVTFGGLPRGRATLICGSPGCGKTMLGVEFLVNGARKYSEPGVFVAFEETKNELVVNAASLDFDLDKLALQHKVSTEVISTGVPDLDAMLEPRRMQEVD
jgi:circadian clock protein KaiC